MESSPSSIPDLRLREVTGAECGRIADSLELSVRELDLRPPPTSDLACMIARMRRLSSSSGPVLHPGIPESDRRQVLEDFLRIEQSRRLAGILHWCRRVNGIDRITIRLRKQFDRIQTQRAPTHDVLAEMQTAARFACAGYEVAFEEPDVVVRIPQVGAFGVAVKRPRSQGQVGKHISKGARQINQTQMPGLVLLDVEPMLHDDGHGGLAFNLCNTLDDLAIGSTKIIRAIRDEAERPLRSALGGWCYGVIFGGLSTAQTSNPIAEVFSWNVISVANAEIARAAEMVAIAEQALMCMPFQPDV